MAQNPKKFLRGKIPDPGLPPQTVPKRAAQPALLSPSPSGTFVVRWARFDFDGPWCLGLSDSTAIVDLMRRLKAFESMRPIDIFGTTKSYPGTDYDVARVPNQDAVKRLSLLGFGDETRISRLQIGGLPRLYGFRRDPEFYAVFWDPKHVIWPPTLRHT